MSVFEMLIFFLQTLHICFSFIDEFFNEMYNFYLTIIVLHFLQSLFFYSKINHFLFSFQLFGVSNSIFSPEKNVISLSSHILQKCVRKFIKAMIRYFLQLSFFLFKKGI